MDSLVGNAIAPKAFSELTSNALKHHRTANPYTPTHTKAIMILLCRPIHVRCFGPFTHRQVKMPCLFLSTQRMLWQTCRKPCSTHWDWLLLSACRYKNGEGLEVAVKDREGKIENWHSLKKHFTSIEDWSHIHHSKPCHGLTDSGTDTCIPMDTVSIAKVCRDTTTHTSASLSSIGYSWGVTHTSAPLQSVKQTTVRSLHDAQHVKSASQSVVREVVNKTRATSLKLINDCVKECNKNWVRALWEGGK